MSNSSSGERAERGERWLTFQIGGTMYALPIAGVAEVVEPGPATCVPSLPRERAGVVNWHGDALPVLAAEALLDEGADAQGADDVAAEPRPEDLPTRQSESESASESAEDDGDPLQAPQILVVENPGHAPSRFGLPVDSVLGLVDAAPLRPRAGKVVVERTSLGGRVVGMIDPRQLCVRAGSMVESLVA